MQRKSREESDPAPGGLAKAGATGSSQLELQIASEVYDLYRFLHQYVSMAPNRKKDILRASVNYTPYGYIFGGLVSVSAAAVIDDRLAAKRGEDPCLDLQRDHFHSWKDTAHHFFAGPVVELDAFWSELKRRNEIVLVTKADHAKVSKLQRQGLGIAAYAAAGVELVRVDTRAIKLQGNRAGLARAYWTIAKDRVSARL